ncbi:murein L,D-transpeptidase [Rhodomicrobium sp. Az07]|uniref:L,D-transpeptidase family protein n=1 Tax=Rhodomicrobium sp. Az07 TaxID=2839034 RepID=UPI001BE6136D|nr:murein L,D-transpeptidase family protein [Rhodomicrobium sp. Az07]MBT3070805.1 murein L,D-transpeptidase [Rhodomicrobium sp. Az07]
MQVLISIFRVSVAGALAGALTVLTLTLWPDLIRRGEENLVRVRLAVYDAQRLLYAKLGWPLPGTPDLGRLDERLAEKGVARGAPVFIRIFKRERELELWMKSGDRFVLFASYPVCRYSGGLGPKLREGDRQAPEGFYTVGRSQLNPNSSYRRSFNLGYPNLYDAANGRTGSFLMVHGACLSVGCYAMTDPVIDEIWDLVTAALDGRQKRFSVHIFPFRMTETQFAVHSSDQWDGFWRDLKRGYDLFEASLTPPQIGVCAKAYVARSGAPGSLGDLALAERCDREASQRP